MTEEDYLQFQFVRITLKKHGFYLRDLFWEDIDSKNLRESGELRYSISFEVKKAGEKGGELTFNFSMHGRFIEIRYQKFKKAGANSFAKLRSNAINQLWGLKNIRKNDNKAKNTRWYTKNVFGAQNDLIRELSFGYTENVRLTLRNQFIPNSK